MENSLYFLLNSAQQSLFREVDRLALESVGVSAAQISALVYLQKRNGCLQAELGQAMGLGKAATSGMVSRLEKNGLIYRTPSPTDGRGQRVLLTVDGLQALARAKPLLVRLNYVLEDGFKEREKVIIRRFLDAIIDKLSDE